MNAVAAATKVIFTKIKDLLLVDPSTQPLVNNGQARLVDKIDDAEQRELRGELGMFVCEGEFAKGLDLILSSFLTNLRNASQLAAWVSGFFGSGKSTVLKILAHLWANTVFSDGATARGLVPKLPKNIQAHLTELDTASRRYGGVFMAAGTLLSGSHDRVRECVAGIILRSAGLPDKFPIAKFCLWLEREGGLDAVRAHVEANGGTWTSELSNLWVSKRIPKAILAWDPGYAASEADVRNLIKEQFQQKIGDLSTPEFVEITKDVLQRHARLYSNNAEQLPCSLIVLDEVQQFIGDSHDRSTIVTELAEALTKQFNGRVMLVGAGQQALSSVELLHKLMDRFKVQVPLSDSDVETVTRKVTLQKKPTAVTTVQEVIETYGGEIARHLQGSKIAPTAADAATIVADFPLLPVTRRFWEECFRQIDAEGTRSQLRSQLGIIHTAVGKLADKPITSVVPADELYESLKGPMLAQGVLLRELHTKIEELGAPGTPDAILSKRIASIVFLISKLPTAPGADLGVRATADHIADLLIEDLAADNHALRQEVAQTLDKLVADALLMKVGAEYRMQTRAGSEWLATFTQKQHEIGANLAVIQEVRNQLLAAALNGAVSGVRYVHGHPKEPRAVVINRDATPPTATERDIVLWIRDGWSAAEKDVVSAARSAGAKSPLIYGFIPQSWANDLKTAIVAYEAASRTLDTYGPQSEAEGQEAAAGMTSRMTAAKTARDRLIQDIVGSTKIFLGGGNEQLQANLFEKLNAAVGAAAARQFPQFGDADKASWDVAMKRAKDGADRPFEPVGHTGAVETHPVCVEVLAQMGAGNPGNEIRSKLQDPPFGWPKEAIDAALTVLVAAGHASAKLNGAAIQASQFDHNKISKTVFTKETKTISTQDRLKVRNTLAKLGVVSRSADDDAPKAAEFLDKLVALGRKTGGEAPLPAPQSVTFIEDLQGLTGVEQLCKMVEKKADLDAAADTWVAIADLAEERGEEWTALEHLFRHAEKEPGAAAIHAEIEAVRTGRQLLDPTNPLPPIRARVADILRQRLKATHEDHCRTYEKEIGQLKASPVWAGLPSDEQDSILAGLGLRAPEDVDVSTDVTIAAALATQGIESRVNAAFAVPGQVARALAKAAEKTEPETRSCAIEKAVLRNEAEVRDWANRTQAHLIAEVQKGPVLVS